MLRKLHACTKADLRPRSDAAVVITAAGLADGTTIGARLVVACRSSMQGHCLLDCFAGAYKVHEP